LRKYSRGKKKFQKVFGKKIIRSDFSGYTVREKSIWESDFSGTKFPDTNHARKFLFGKMMGGGGAENMLASPTTMERSETP